MNFILKMAWRDSRTARRRLLLFSLSIVLGVAALVAIGSLSINLKQGIDGQAKELLGADLEVSSRVALTPEAEAFLAGLGGERAREISFASMAVFPSAERKTRLVSLRALEAGYPYYGEFLTAPVDAPARLRSGDTVIVEETLLKQFNVKVGDPLKLGTKTFTIAGALQKIPGESAAVAMLSPRVYVNYSALEGTGLLGPGSLVRYKVYFKFPAGTDVEDLVADLRGRFRELRLGFDTVAERKRELGQALQSVYAFLSLVGFIALFLGAIGVASAIHVYIRQKISTVAVLRCLGASARQSFAVYLVQGLALGLFGAVLGAALGVVFQMSLATFAKGLLPFDVDFFIAWSAVGRGVVSGLVICLLFTLLPLLAVRRVSPLVAIRAATADDAGKGDPLRWSIYGAIVFAVTGFAIWQTQKLSWGLGFTAALLVSFGVLTAMAKVIAWSARRFMPRGLPYVWRQGVANLHRPNNRTVLLLLSLGLGTFLLLTLAFTRETLIAQIRDTGGSDRPNLLFFDVQDDQIEPLHEILRKAERPFQQAPIVTMKLASLKGRTIDEILKDREGPRIPAWTLRREYRSTFRGEIAPTEKIIAGEFVPRVAADVGVVPVSMETGLARDMQLKLGDELTFDVQGVPVKARIASLREVEWRRLSPNFFVVFPLGVLEGAPKFYVAATQAQTPDESVKLQQQIVQAFPNVSAIDLALVVETLDGIFSKVQLVVQVMAMFTVITGIIVLAGAVLTGRFQRVRETVLLRTLGASKRQLVSIQLVEYLVLGVLAAFVGGGLAFGANAALAIFVFKSPIVAPLGLLFVAVAGVTGLTLITGLLSNRGVTDHPPLEVLRAET